MTEYLPAVHAIQSTNALLPNVSKYVPAGQLRHVVSEDEPWMTEYLPAAQLRHDVAPSSDPYFPARQRDGSIHRVDVLTQHRHGLVQRL